VPPRRSKFVVWAGCASTPTRESTGEYVDDSVITAKVEAELGAGKMVSRFQISVETYIRCLRRQPRDGSRLTDQVLCRSSRAARFLRSHAPLRPCPEKLAVDLGRGRLRLSRIPAAGEQ
jgi:hypothetical protein